ncbi:MAG: NUDIX domain-containing protein [Bacilli bacterium]|nr:NUDIX domain-containing protein [Bacilli bacterium]
MKEIAIITDEDFGLVSVPFTNPRVRIGARGIVLDKQGNMAVFNKTNKKEYKLPGGGVEGKEDPSTAFLREVLEETGCTVEIVKKLGIIEEHKSLNQFKQISHVYVGRVIGHIKELQLTQKEKDEGGQILWMPVADALQAITNCAKELKASFYENLYHSRFIVERDKRILEYYMKQGN